MIMKIITLLAFVLFLAGCEEHYRYPCQDPKNWNDEQCKKPYCSANGTCPEDLAHYLKDGQKPQTVAPQQVKENKGACK